MAIMITDDCIYCGACVPECPNTAIYEEGAQWRWSDGTKLREVETIDGRTVGGNEPQEPLSNEYYYIVTDKCKECVGFHEEPQCAAVCPVDCCVDDPDHRETRERLTQKQQWLHKTAA